MYLEIHRQVGKAFENKGKAKGGGNAHQRQTKTSYTN
jgi:hypothetical protein